MKSASVTQGLVTLPVLATAFATGLLLRVRKLKRSRNPQIVPNAGRDAESTDITHTGMIAADATQRLWLLLLHGAPLMILSTGIVALAAGPACAGAVAAVGLLRILLLYREQRQLSTSGPADACGGASPEEHAAGTPQALNQGGDQRHQQPAPLPISGIWRKVNSLSEPMDDMMNLVKLNPIIRRAVFLVNGLELHVTNEEFQMSVLCAIPWFKVTERYPMNGESRNFRRRDYRRGQHTGMVTPIKDGGVRVQLKWPDPCAGSGTDTMWCPEPDVLHVKAVATVNGKSASYLHVYHRRL